MTKLNRVFLTVAILLTCGSLALAADWASVGEELRKMRDRDQAGIKAANGDPSKVEPVFRQNLVRLKEIVKESGWPTQNLVGEEGAQGAWMIVQHADFDPKYQREVLDILKPLSTKGEIHPEQYPLLLDRVAKNAGEPQTYGSQGHCVAPQTWEPYFIKDVENLDIRRSAAQLASFDTYKRQVSKFCH